VDDCRNRYARGMPCSLAYCAWAKIFFIFFSVDVQSHCATLLTIRSCTYGDFNVLCGSAILHALSDSYSLHFKFLLTNSLFVSLFKIVYYLTV
jgi:hypothetical protein